MVLHKKPYSKVILHIFGTILSSLLSNFKVNSAKSHNTKLFHPQCHMWM